jgi:hypothetical protein
VFEAKENAGDVNPHNFCPVVFGLLGKSRPRGDRNYPDFFLGVAAPAQALPQLFARNQKVRTL